MALDGCIVFTVKEALHQVFHDIGATVDGSVDDAEGGHTGVHCARAGEPAHVVFGDADLSERRIKLPLPEQTEGARMPPCSSISCAC